MYPLATQQRTPVPGRRLVWPLGNGELQPNSQDFMVHQHTVSPGALLPVSETRHGIWFLLSQSAEGEQPIGQTAIPQFMLPEDLVIVPAGVAPKLRLLKPAQFLYVGFACGYLQRLCELHGLSFAPLSRVRLGVREPAMSSLLALLQAEVEGQCRLGTLYVEALVHALAARYLALSLDEKHPERVMQSALPARALHRVQEVVEARLGSSLSLEDLAGECGYSKGHFLRMFRGATGLTPHQYVLERRLQRACLLLHTTMKTVRDISVLCGFANQAHMSDLFRKRLGVTPLHFKRAAKGTPMLRREPYASGMFAAPSRVAV